MHLFTLICPHRHGLLYQSLTQKLSNQQQLLPLERVTLSYIFNTRKSRLIVDITLDSKGLGGVQDGQSHVHRMRMSSTGPEGTLSLSTEALPTVESMDGRAAHSFLPLVYA